MVFWFRSPAGIFVGGIFLNIGVVQFVRVGFDRLVALLPERGFGDDRGRVNESKNIAEKTVAVQNRIHVFEKLADSFGSDALS